MSTEDILNLFTSDKCKALENRAKIVIIQACRGNQMLAVDRDGSRARLVEYTADSVPCSGRVVDRRADTLVFRSCLPKRLSFLSKDSGSRFITHICHAVLRELIAKGRCEFGSVAKTVMNTMTVNTITFDGREVICTPEKTNDTLKKHLFLSLPPRPDNYERVKSVLVRLARHIERHDGGQTQQADRASGCSCINSGCKPHTKCRCQREGRPCGPGCHRVENATCFNTEGPEGPKGAEGPEGPAPQVSLRALPGRVAPSEGCRCVNSGCKPHTKCRCQREERRCTPACRCVLAEEGFKCTNGQQDAERQPTPPRAAAAVAASAPAARSILRGCRCIGSGCKPNTKCRCQREGRPCGPGCHQVENAPCANAPRPCACDTACTTDKCGCRQAGGPCHRDCHPGSAKCRNADAEVRPAPPPLTADGGARQRGEAGVGVAPPPQPPPRRDEPAAEAPRLKTPARGCCRCIGSGCGPNTKCRCRRERKACTPGCHQVEDAPCSNTASCGCTTQCMTDRCRCHDAGRPCSAECHPHHCSNGGDINSDDTSDESNSDVETLSSEEEDQEGAAALK